ncbi:hypothetical protein WISP_103849 [Willisornis vidua]|uniref:Uncharacterized protein n=1 Tax=Willisornis vidua TaxID=1566151 RepID=A0ABQ9D3K9_9PASS|nr:hypothetical protein WISP_103849 [Willisornis vidua]
MLSGSSSDPGYFQLKEGASSKPLLISATNWRYTQRRQRLLRRHESAEPEKRVYKHVPLQEIKTGGEETPNLLRGLAVLENLNLKETMATKPKRTVVASRHWQKMLRESED